MSRGLTILAMMFAAGALGSTDFGQLGAIQATLIMVAGLIADALRITAARQIAVQSADDSRETGRIVTFVFVVALTAGLLITGGMYLLAPWIATHLLSDLTLLAPLRIGVVLLLCEALNGLCLGVQTGLREFRAMALAGAASGMALLLLIGPGAEYGVMGVVSVLACASALGLLIRIALILQALRMRDISLRFELRATDMNTLWQLSLPALMSGLCFAPVNWLVTVMLVRTENGFHQLGLIGAATQWFSLLLFLPNVVGTILLPHLSGAFGRSDQQGLREALRLGIRTNLQIALPAILIIAMFSNLIMSWYGSSYADGAPVLTLLALAAGAGALQNLFGNLFAAVNRMWQALSTQLTWAGVYLAGAYVSLQLEMGATGIAAAMLMAYLAKAVHASICIRNAFKQLNNEP